LQSAELTLKKQAEARAFWPEYKAEEEAFLLKLQQAPRVTPSAASTRPKKINQQSSGAGTSASAGVLSDAVATVTAIQAQQSMAFESRAYSGSWPMTRCNTVRNSTASGTFQAHTIVQDFMDNPAAWKDGLPLDFPDQLLGNDEDKKKWSELADMELEVLKLQEELPPRERRVIFVRHKNDQPPQQEEYDPVEDCKKFHIAIARVEGAKFNRGWEIVQIDSEVQKPPGRRPYFVATYLNIQRVAAAATAWPDRWVESLFTHLLRKPERVPGVRTKPTEPFQEPFLPADCIMWSTEAKVTNGALVLKIPQALWPFAYQVVASIEAGTQVHVEMPQIGAGEDGDD
jgi:hypothetical protein